MRILALDVGTECGWADLDKKAQTLDFGVMDLSTNRWEGGGMRFLRFRQELDHMHKERKFDVVVYEEVRRHSSTDAAHMYGGWQAVITAWCEEIGLPYSSVPVGMWKKKLTGNGNAGKPVVMAHVQKLGFDIKNQNAADALAIALWAESVFA